jgi:protein required for attachment to host cells
MLAGPAGALIVVDSAVTARRPIGVLTGSDYPQIAAELVRLGVDSISVTPGTMIKTTLAVLGVKCKLGVRAPRRGMRPNRRATMRVRIVVADQSEADFYDLERRDMPLLFVRRLEDPDAHLHDRDLRSDRPGRVFDHAPAAAGRRGAVAHHTTEGERNPRKVEARRFARRIAEALDEERRQGRYDRLVVMAPPAFLGLLRAEMPAAVRATLTAEIGKDLVHEPAETLIGYLPPGTFTRHPITAD